MLDPRVSSNDPIKPENCPIVDKNKAVQDKLEREQMELDLMWDQIQELKQTDELAAQVLYEKYRRRAGDIPPATPTHIVEDQAVS